MEITTERVALAAAPLPPTWGGLVKFPPLDQETRAVVPTACAAYHLGRQPQTLRSWACMENGPLRPVRLNGRLAWRVAELRQLVEGTK